jgi:hypothetical protein
MLSLFVSLSASLSFVIYLFLSAIPVLLFLFMSTALSFHPPIFVSLSFFLQYFKPTQYKIVYKNMKHEIHVNNILYNNSAATSQ